MCTKPVNSLHHLLTSEVLGLFLRLYSTIDRSLGQDRTFALFDNAGLQGLVEYAAVIDTQQ